MSTPFEISDRFTDEWAAEMPILATEFGISGHDDECTDYSPEAVARRADLYRRTREALSPHMGNGDDEQSFGARVLGGWVDEQIAEYESNKWRRDLNHVYSPFQQMRDIFDVMGKDTVEDWEAIAARLEGMGGMLAGYRACLEAGLSAGDTVATRQAESVVEQAELEASDQSRFTSYTQEAEGSGIDVEKVDEAVRSARRAFGEFAQWLRSSYLPGARSEDAVGRDAYLGGVDEFLGMELDPEETYSWGWDEVHRLRAEMEATAAEIDADASLTEVIDTLESDPQRSAATREEFVEFVSALQQQAIAQLDGEHFEVPDELKVVGVHMAPPGGSLGAWYMSPTEDFSRPGSIWYAPGSRERLPYWQEVTTAYHEGFPGHHLQVGTMVLQREKLTRFHRVVIWYSGAGEGWALYAERIMDELGFFEKPEYRLGLLASQLFRSVRVVVDIGCHLGLEIPDGAPLYGGEVWDYERAVDYVEKIGLQPRDIAESEVKRYLGWWGQAISYKVGEREILDIRDRARSAPDFDLKVFHEEILRAGAIRLDQLRDAML